MFGAQTSPDAHGDTPVQAADAVPRTAASHVTFRDQLLAELPRMRGAAVFLTRNPSDTDDLLQTTALRAMNAQHQFTLGTNMRAWLYRIMRNEFIDNYRIKRFNTPLEDAAEPFVSVAETQMDRLILGEVLAAVRKLRPLHCEALLLTAQAEMSYDEVAAIQGCSIGTVKSRVARARAQLRHVLEESFEPKSLPHRALAKYTGAGKCV